MTLKRLSEFGLSLVLSLSSLLVIAVPKVHAAALSWDGEGSDDNFSTAANWSGDVSPQDGDTLTFDPAITGSGALNNDLTNLSLAGITILAGTSGQVRIAGNAITLTGDVDVAHAFLLEANIVLGSSVEFNILSDEIALVTSVISGSGNLAKAGAGDLHLEGNNASYNGAVSINSGLLEIGHINALGTNAGGTTIAVGAMLGVYGLAFDATIVEPLTMSGNITSEALAVAHSFHSGGSAPSPYPTITFSGAINLLTNVLVKAEQKNIKFTGSCSGNFTINKKNSFANGTIAVESSPNDCITEGEVKIQPSETTYSANSPATSINVLENETATVNGTYGTTSVGSGGTLKGTGTVGALTVDAGGKLAPGLSPGCINSGNLTLSGTYEVEIGGATECSGYDRTNVTGTVDVTGGTLSVIKFNNFVPTAGQVYQIIANDVADAVTGTFTNLAEGATVTVEGVVYRVSYVGGDGNDVTLTVVSVPATPETGFQMLTNNPLTTLAGTMLAAGAILMIAKKYNRVSARR